MLEIHTKETNIPIGKISIPFDNMHSQDEFECSIEIPDEYDSTIYSGSILLKLQYIKSYYKYYSELALKSENECIDLLNDIKKVHLYFENLNRTNTFKFKSLLISSTN